MKYNSNIINTLLIFLGCLCTFIPFVHAQSFNSHNVYKTEDPVHIDLFFKNFDISESVNRKTTFKSIHTIPSKPFTHHRYRQFIDQKPVYKSMLLLHTKDDYVHSYHGQLFTGEVIESNRPLLTQEAIEQYIQQDLYSQVYVPKQGSVSFSDARLVYIDEQFPKTSKYALLAYEIMIEAGHHYKYEYVIDAYTGHIIFKENQIAHTNVPAKGVSPYYGEVDFKAEKIGDNQYELSDFSRGEGIRTAINTFGNWALDEDNYWNNDFDGFGDVSVDAHYCTTTFYDYLIGQLNWNGLDNAGKNMVSVVYNTKNGKFVNAFWNGKCATFGNGDCHRGPLTTMEVVAHEFTHGITDYTSDLIYKSESGAINESMSDVLGKALEHHYDPSKLNWSIGESFLLDDFTNPFRSMSDPKSLNMPQTYKGAFWNDNGGVHTNSAVGNHFFYRLAKGGTGITEKEEPFDFQGVGIKKAVDIIFEVQKGYLTPTSTYNDYYNYSIEVVHNLFGANSEEAHAVKEAWRVVGLPYETNTEPLAYDLSVELIGSFYRTHCGINEFVPVSYLLINRGTETIEKDEKVEINFYFKGTNESRTIPLSDPLVSGDTLEFTIDDLIYVSETSNVYFNTYITFDKDENIANNKANVYFVFYTITENDLKLRNVKIINQYCSENEHIVQCNIQNQACNSYQVSKPLKVKMIDQNTQELIGTLEYNTGVIYSGSSVPLETTFQFPDVQDLNVDFILSVDDDVTDYNNTVTHVKIPTNDFIVGTYSENMEGSSPMHTFHNEHFSNNFYYDNNGNINLWTTGYYSNNNKTVCLDPIDNFEGDNRVQTTFGTCLDISELDNPVLSFDLTQFVNTSGKLEEINQTPFGAFLYISYHTVDGELLFQKTISGQKEGEKVEHTLALPPNSAGVLKFNFYNHTGTAGKANMEFNETLDNQLIDNIKISNVTNTNAVNKKSVQVFPNPLADYCTIEANQTIQKIEIIDMQGRVVLKQDQISNTTYQMNTQHFMPGSYMLRTTLDNQKVEIQKLVVIR